MSQPQREHRRVATFSAVDAHKLHGTEWLRSEGQSTKTVDEMINEFLDKNQVEPVSISAPRIEKIHTSNSGDVITYRTSCAIIYTPSDVVYDETTHPEEVVPNVPLPNPGGFPEQGAGLPAGVAVPDDAKATLLKQLSDQLGFRVVEASPTHGG